MCALHTDCVSPSVTGVRSHFEDMLFYSCFRTLVGQTVTVELKNDVSISGVLESVDQYLNLKLERTQVEDQKAHPQLMSVSNCFIRGSVVRYVRLARNSVDTDALHDATRREARSS
jgi:U6 snRNA-associated Sm-like protein LSm2